MESLTYICILDGKYEQIKPDCKYVERVFYLFKHHSNYIRGTDLEYLVEFIIWCNSSMVFDDKYTDVVVMNFLANGVTHINNELVFKDQLRLFTDKGVNLKKFRKCMSKISKFRSEIYMFLSSDILELSP